MKKNLILLSCFLLTLITVMPAKAAVDIKNTSHGLIGVNAFGYPGFFKPSARMYPMPLKSTITGFNIYYTITHLWGGDYSITLNFIGLNGSTPVVASAPTAITVYMELQANGSYMYPSVTIPVGFTSGSQYLYNLNQPPTLTILSTNPTSFDGLPIYHVQP